MCNICNIPNMRNICNVCKTPLYILVIMRKSAPEARNARHWASELVKLVKIHFCRPTGKGNSTESLRKWAWQEFTVGFCRGPAGVPPPRTELLTLPGSPRSLPGRPHLEHPYRGFALLGPLAAILASFLALWWPPPLEKCPRTPNNPIWGAFL